MPLERLEPSKNVFSAIGRYFLRRLEMPLPTYQKRIINNMENLYRVIQPGDILLVEGRSQLSQIIQLLTKSSWSHAAIYIGDNLRNNNNTRLKNLMDQFDVKEQENMLIEADAGNGVIAVPLKKYQDYNIRICRPFGILPQDLEAVVQETIANIGKHYDHENLVDLALLVLPSFLNPFKKRTIQACLGGCTEYKVICSGMIAMAFQSVGYPIIPALHPNDESKSNEDSNPYGSKLIMRHYSQIVPRDFDLSPNFEIVKYNIIELGKFNYQSIWANNIVSPQNIG
jgi:cell wall-associated NlpC family hydrolase